MSVPWDRTTVAAFNAVIIATAHRAIRWQDLTEWSACVIDTRNAMAEIATTPGQVWKA